MEHRTPIVLWAQRKDRVFVTIECPNADAPKVNLTDEGVLTFSAMAGTDSTEEKHRYDLKLELLHPVNAKDSKISVGPRHIVVVVQKTEENSGPHWPRLLKQKHKDPHVKTDFDKWVDEDEEEEMDRDAAFNLSQLESMDLYRDTDAFMDAEDSDDDDDMPDLQKI